MRSMLLIEPDEPTRQRLCELGRTLEAEVVAFSSSSEADGAVHALRYDLALLSHGTALGCDLEFIRRLRQTDADLVCCALMVGEGSASVTAAGLGVDDLVDASLPNDALLRILRRMLERGRLAHRRSELRSTLSGHLGSSGIVARSPKMKHVLSLVQAASQSRCPVLIVGTPGSGKRTLASAIHRGSDRRYQQMHIVSCDDTHGADWESQLFGREAAAFARGGGREGMLGRAAGTTLIVRYLERMPATCQDRMAEMLETGRFSKVMGCEQFHCGVRLIGLASTAIDAEARARRFRQDLFHRLNQVRIDVPPLRECRESIPLLATQLLERLRGMSTPPVTSIAPEAMRLLLAHDWPENIRELERCLRLAVARTSGSVVRVEALPAAIRNLKRPPHAPDNSLIDTSRPLADVAGELIEQVEREYLVTVLKRYRGRITSVARHSGLSRRGVTDKMHRLGISRDAFAAPYLFDELKSAQ